MRAVILGGTRGMGRAVARRLAERGEALYLLGRDPHELERSAADLEARGALDVVGYGKLDLWETERFEEALDEAEAFMGKPVNTVIVTAAMFGTQDELEGDLDAARAVMTINLTNTIAFCEVARRRILRAGGGTLCVFSSVAGDAPRKPVGIYGAAKAGLSHYLQSLDLRYRGQGLNVVCVKPGFVKTGMTDGLEPPPFAGEPGPVSRDVVRAMTKGQHIVYTPPIWRFVMMAIKAIPHAAMRRIDF